MKKTLLFLLMPLIVGVWSTNAAAASADFQGNCTGRAPTYCVLDTTRTSSGGSGTSCGSASITQYFWDFGDDEWTWTTSTSVAHTFDDIDTYSVKLTVFCSNGTSAMKTICVNTVPIGVYGCIHPYSGWQP